MESELKNLFKLMDLLDTSIPNNSEETLDLNGIKIIVSKKDGNVNIKMTTEDFSDVKKMIAEYKSMVEELDDCSFVEATEEMKKHFDIKHFDQLLNQVIFTPSDIDELNEMIDMSQCIICDFLEKKINKLVDIYNKIQDSLE